jgi:hypothetical protein
MILLSDVFFKSGKGGGSSIGRLPIKIFLCPYNSLNFYSKIFLVRNSATVITNSVYIGMNTGIATHAFKLLWGDSIAFVQKPA